MCVCLLQTWIGLAWARAKQRPVVQVEVPRLTVDVSACRAYESGNSRKQEKKKEEAILDRISPLTTGWLKTAVKKLAVIGEGGSRAGTEADE